MKSDQAFGNSGGGRLGRKLLGWVLLGSAMCTLLGTVIQLTSDYRRDLAALEEGLEQIRTSRLSSLSSSVWYVDEDQIGVQLDGIMDIRGMRYAEVRTPEGMVLFRGVRPGDASVMLREYPLLHANVDRQERIGTLMVAADTSTLTRRLQDRILLILITQGVQFFLVAMLVMGIFNLLVTRHLRHMARYASALTIHSLASPLILDAPRDPSRPDEIDTVVQAFNSMRENLLKDIRQREETEVRLTQAESYIRSILDSMPSVLVSVDMHGTVTQWNQQAVVRTGVTAGQAVGAPLESVFATAPVDLRQIRVALQQAGPLKLSKVQERRGETVGYVDVTVYPLLTAGMQGAVIRIDDVTERVHLEEMMIQSEKMLTLGGLAAGMAHEINNPLAGILQNAQVLRNRTRPDLAANRKVAAELSVELETLQAYLERRGCLRMLDAITEAGARAARIVENMLSFSRKSSVQKAPVDLCALLDRTLELAANDYDLKKRYDFRKIAIERNYAPDVPCVSCDAGKVQQVFFNLIRNGAQAMATRADARFVCRVARVAEHVRIEIEDNGPGMSEDTRRRIFEPFFSTKRVGEGTGLGLSVSYFIIVENHGGRLDVESAPGRGTLFSILLPIASGELAPADASREREEATS